MFIEQLHSRMMLSGVPRFDRVVLVAEENHSKASAPYFDFLKSHGASLDNHSTGKPSQPNYISLASGSTHGFKSNSFKKWSGENLFSQISAAGKSVAGYSEDASETKHEFWRTNDAIKKYGKPFSQFPINDPTKLPAFSVVVPNKQHNMHDGTIAQADAWLKSNLSKYADFAAKPENHALLIVWWDEGTGSVGDSCPLYLYGAGVKTGSIAGKVNHFNVNSTISAFFGLAPITKAATITNSWSSSPIDPPPDTLPGDGEYDTHR